MPPVPKKTIFSIVFPTGIVGVVPDSVKKLVVLKSVTLFQFSKERLALAFPKTATFTIISSPEFSGKLIPVNVTVAIPVGSPIASETYLTVLLVEKSTVAKLPLIFLLDDQGADKYVPETLFTKIGCA